MTIKITQLQEFSLQRGFGRLSWISPVVSWSGRSPSRSPPLLAFPASSSSSPARATVSPFELSDAPTTLREEMQRHTWLSAAAPWPGTKERNLRSQLSSMRNRGRNSFRNNGRYCCARFIMFTSSSWLKQSNQFGSELPVHEHSSVRRGGGGPNIRFFTVAHQSAFQHLVQ